MSIKAKLRVVLHADDTIVAETDNAALWQKILLAINNGTSNTELGGVPELDFGTNDQPSRAQIGDAVEKFAKEMGLPRAEVEGACAPSTLEPYLHLDIHCWEAMKKQTAERGPTAFSAMAISSTLLALWFRAAGLGAPTQAQAQAVLATISVRDQNPSRGIERSDWLQSRQGGVVQINPANISRALALARSFCSKKWAKDAAAA